MRCELTANPRSDALWVCTVAACEAPTITANARTNNFFMFPPFTFLPRYRCGRGLIFSARAEKEALITSAALCQQLLITFIEERATGDFAVPANGCYFWP